MSEVCFCNILLRHLFTVLTLPTTLCWDPAKNICQSWSPKRSTGPFSSFSSVLVSVALHRDQRKVWCLLLRDNLLAHLHPPVTLHCSAGRLSSCFHFPEKGQCLSVDTSCRGSRDPTKTTFGLFVFCFVGKFLWETKKEEERAGRREEESQANSTLSTELDSGLGLRPPRSRPELKPKSWMLNRLCHPDAPKTTFLHSDHSPVVFWSLAFCLFS